MRRVLLPGALVACLFVLSTYSALSATKPESKPITKEARLQSPSKDRDDIRDTIRKATNQAIYDALRSFALQQIDPATWTTERPTIEWFLRIRAKDFIQKYKVEKVDRKQEVFVHVTVSVWLEETAFRKALMTELVRPAAFVVLVTEQGEATEQHQALLQSQLAESLLASGVQVASPEALIANQWRKSVEAFLQGDLLAANSISLGFLAEVGLKVRLNSRFSQNNQGIISALSSASLQAIRLTDGKVLFAKAFPGQKGFGLDLAQAIDDSCQRIGESLADYVLAEATKWRESQVCEITLISSKGLSEELWDSLHTVLASEPAVREVKVGPDLIYCLIEGNAYMVAAAADTCPGVTVTKCEPRQITLEASPEPNASD